VKIAFLGGFNRYVLEKTRALLNEFNLSTCLWGEAIMTAAYLRNIIPTTGQKHTPYELMYDAKPCADHLRVFGCEAVVHIPKTKRDKLDPTGITGMFVGYADNSKAWRVMHRDSKGKLCVTEAVSVSITESRSPHIIGLSGREQQSRHELHNDQQAIDINTIHGGFELWEEGLVHLPIGEQGVDVGASAQTGDVESTDAEEGLQWSDD
jgi:hypothetical protein